MKTPREIKTIVIDERAHNNPKTKGLFPRKTVTDYISPVGIVREVLVDRKIPKYYMKDTGQVVNVKFYGEMIASRLLIDPEEIE